VGGHLLVLSVHELGHLLLHGNETFIELEGKAEVHKPAEEEADAFARDNLISLDDYAAFVPQVTSTRDLSWISPLLWASTRGSSWQTAIRRQSTRNRCNSLRVLYDFQADESTSAA